MIMLKIKDFFESILYLYRTYIHSTQMNGFDGPNITCFRVCLFMIIVVILTILNGMDKMS